MYGICIVFKSSYYIKRQRLFICSQNSEKKTQQILVRFSLLNSRAKLEEGFSI